jgi:hypothetical protein
MLLYEMRTISEAYGIKVSYQIAASDFFHGSMNSPPTATNVGNYATKIEVICTSSLFFSASPYEGLS